MKENNLKYRPIGEEDIIRESQVYFYGNRLTFLRVLRGYSVSDVATSLGVTIEKVTVWEGENFVAVYNKKNNHAYLVGKSIPCKKPTDMMVERIAKLLGVKPSFFFNYEVDINSTIIFTGMKVTIRHFNEEDK